MPLTIKLVLGAVLLGGDVPPDNEVRLVWSAFEFHLDPSIGVSVLDESRDIFGPS
jgi:hypothetical protein